MPEITKRLSVVMDIFGGDLKKKKKTEDEDDTSDEEFNKSTNWDD